MIVVGGSYRETCIVPYWRRIFGSGGRAAMAVGALSPASALYTYACRGWANDVRRTMTASGIIPHVTEIDDDIEFGYWHPLLKMGVPSSGRQYDDLVVTGDVVLSFGMIEGRARVDAGRLVCDPQSSTPESFRLPEGSQAKSLAFVIKETDLPVSDGEETKDAIGRIIAGCDAEVIVTRNVLGGADVYLGEAPPVRVPAYRSKSWFKIGAGDVFAAVFAYYWGERRLDPRIAADHASRAVAFFNDDGRLPIPAAEDLVHLVPIGVLEKPQQIALSAPLRTMSQIWLLEEAFDFLTGSLKAKVFSPFHELEPPPQNRRFAAQTLEKLKGCSAVLAIVDGGDLEANIHVGFARAKGIPVVLLAESVGENDMTMFAGTDCEIVKDFPSALYRAYLASLRTAEAVGR
jgi:nucleoside 2-deoxyribosyltransferase